MVRGFRVVVWALGLGIAFATGQARGQQAFATRVSQPTPAADAMARWLHVVAGKRVGLVVNQTSLVRTSTGSRHLVDTLRSLGVAITRVFAPEHGFRGEAQAGEHVASGIDVASGLPIVSLYGTHKKPLPSDLANIDLLIFDIQDVGARFYTYISTLHYVLEAAAQQGIPVLVLDRPNPNGMYVDGPMLEPEHRSFVGIWPLPVLHGCTVGELAIMAAAQHWFAGADSLQLTVATCLGYSHASQYVLPVPPSPNLPNATAIRLYASLCLFEGTSLSVGRGTDFPFQVVGGPDSALGKFMFTPTTRAGNVPVLADKTCYGLDFRTDSLSYGVDLSPIITLYARSPRKGSFFTPFFTKIAGTTKLRQQIQAGLSAQAIRASWQPRLSAYRALRQQYLLYPD